MNKTNKTNNKNKKEELSPLYKKLSLGPEIRAEEPKGVYPKGRVKQVFAVMSGEMNSLMRVVFAVCDPALFRALLVQ